MHLHTRENLIGACIRYSTQLKKQIIEIKNQRAVIWIQLDCMCGQEGQWCHGRLTSHSGNLLIHQESKRPWESSKQALLCSVRS
jgi:hypothetical protein